MHPINLFFITFISLITIYYYNKHYFKGFSLACFFLLLTPYNIFLEFPGQLPNLTIHRVLVILMFFFWFKNRSLSTKIRNIPFIKSFVLVIATVILSTLFSVVFMKSFKTLLSLLIEQFIFYIIVYTSLNSLKGEDYTKVQTSIIYSIITAISIVAFIGITERWGVYSITSHLPSHAEAPSFLAGQLHVYYGRVKSTYPDPILLGYVLAMTIPLVLTMMDLKLYSAKRKVLMLSFVFMACSLYFTTSRGPWLASILAGGILFFLGSKMVRKKVVYAVVILILVLVFRPQITDSIMVLAKDTMDVTSLKGRSYNYRIELWGKAYKEISKSPLRLWVGYGDLSHEFVDWSGYEEKTGRFSTFWSWDNEYAAMLLDRGFIGFTAFIGFYGLIALRVFRNARPVMKDYKDMYYALWSSIVLYLFMMTNVKVFSPQIIILFWLVVSIAMTFGHNSLNSNGTKSKNYHLSGKQRQIV